MGCSYLRKITKFIRLLLTFTKLCHIKCCHLGKFYILLEKMRYLCNSMTDIDTVWHYDLQRLSSASAAEKLILIIKGGVWSIHLSDLFCIFVRYRNFLFLRRWLSATLDY